MKRLLPGIASAALALWLWPSDPPLSRIWSDAASIRPPSHLRPDSASLGSPVRNPVGAPSADDSLPCPDPFGMPPIVVERGTPRLEATSKLAPPPRIWRATGRVGERAAVLTAPDGRVLVVAAGSRVDSAGVVSIGNQGVVLEDRAGRFVLRLP